MMQFEMPRCSRPVTHAPIRIWEDITPKSEKSHLKILKPDIFYGQNDLHLRFDN